jgi:uncharacterized protein (DUF983 family)
VQRVSRGIDIRKTVRMPDFKHPRPKFISFLLCRCPRCGGDKIFPHSILNLKKFAETKETCAKCNLVYQPEPGFFFGAMYWSYALVVGIIIILSIIFSLLDKFDYAITGIPIAIILLLPPVFRYSRVLMLYVVYPLMYKEAFKGKKP